MFKLCIFAAILAVTLAAPATEEAKPAKRSTFGYGAPVVSAPLVSAPIVSAPAVSTSVVASPAYASYSAPLSYSNYVAPASAYPYYGGYYPYGGHYPVASSYYGAYPSPFYY